MRCGLMALVLAMLLAPSPVRGQYQAPSENLLISAAKAATWRTGSTDILLLQGPVKITTERATLTAKDAVVWLSPAKGGLPDHRYAEVSLIGEASVQQPGTTRSGEVLYVDMMVRGSIQLEAERSAEDLSDSDLYRSASALRPTVAQAPGERRGAAEWLLKQPWLGMPGTVPTTAPTTRAVRLNEPISIIGGNLQTTEKTPDGMMAVVLSGPVQLMQRRKDGFLLQMSAQRAVLFTPIRNLREVQNIEPGSIVNAVVGIYLEGDVRFTQSPPNVQTKKAEQRMEAERLYYDTTTERAVLTDVVLHSYDFKKQLPVVVRAKIMRQMSNGEMTAESGTVTSSLLATPSYSVGASTVYIRQIKATDEAEGNTTEFSARNAVARIYDVPVFWFPYMAGVYNDRGIIRNVQLGQGKQFGFMARTEWGVYEALGYLPPQDLDLTINTNYFTKRGPAIGADARYTGGMISETTREPWTFSGDATAFLIHDKGEDDLGKERGTVEPPTPWRGRFFWEHQQFLPDHWQAQITLAYLSDPTFLETWNQRDYDQRLSHDTSFYTKHQDQNEALTFGVSFQFNNFPPTNELVQEQIAGIERIPEIGYYRIGDSVLNDSATFFSFNTFSALRFQGSHASLEEQGFSIQEGFRQSPGLPAIATTGTPSHTVYRGDFREELSIPFSAGDYRVLPYVMARYTAYSDTPYDSSQGRIYGGVGLKISTGFWKIDDTIESDLLDLHRLRHVVEPELNVFWGATNIDRRNLFIYDEPVDSLTDLGVVQLALHQRWQTKRGGAGRWRNVDVFSLNIEGNWFFRRPDEEERHPAQFRGLFFPSYPETSIPRNGINADATWAISDATSIVGEIQYNTDKRNIAMGSILLVFQHDPRLTWSFGFRYVGIDLDEMVNGARFQFDDQKLLQFASTYQITSRYSLDLTEAYDFAGRGNIRSAINLTRRFDRLFVSLGLRVDKIGQDNAIGINVWPEGFKSSKGSGAASGLLGK